MLQDAWTLIATLLGNNSIRTADIRAHMVLAHRYNDGWLAVSAILNNAAVRSYSLPSSATPRRDLIPP